MKSHVISKNQKGSPTDLSSHKSSRIFKTLRVKVKNSRFSLSKTTKLLTKNLIIIFTFIFQYFVNLCKYVNFILMASNLQK